MNTTELAHALEQLGHEGGLGELSVMLRVELAAPMEGHGYVVPATHLRVERQEFLDGDARYRLVIEADPVRPIRVTS